MQTKEGCIPDNPGMQADTEQPAASYAQMQNSMASGSQQQHSQQDRREQSVPAQHSAPASTVEQLCPSLNLKFFTQAGALQVPGAELAQTVTHQSDDPHNLPSSEPPLHMPARLQSTATPGEASQQTHGGTGFQQSSVSLGCDVIADWTIFFHSGCVLALVAHLPRQPAVRGWLRLQGVRAVKQQLLL